MRCSRSFFQQQHLLKSGRPLDWLFGHIEKKCWCFPLFHILCIIFFPPAISSGCLKLISMSGGEHQYLWLLFWKIKYGPRTFRCIMLAIQFTFCRLKNHICCRSKLGSFHAYHAQFHAHQWRWCLREIYIFFETYIRHSLWWQHIHKQNYALKLRFQRQNNRSLWPILSNRFGFSHLALKRK